MFSSSAEERVDKKNLVTHFDHFRHLENKFSVFLFSHLVCFILFLFQIMFATFDPPPATMKDAIGHYCLVTLNLREKRFEFLDSLNDADSAPANLVFRKMVRNIKKVWKDGSASCDEPLNPPTLDGFALTHINVPQQGNGFVPVLLFSFSSFIFFLCK